MLAAFFAFKACKNLCLEKHVKVFVDNTTVQITLNKMGTRHSPKLSNLALIIWSWCTANNIWLTVNSTPVKH